MKRIIYVLSIIILSGCVKDNDEPDLNRVPRWKNTFYPFSIGTLSTFQVEIKTSEFAPYKKAGIETHKIWSERHHLGLPYSPIMNSRVIGPDPFIESYHYAIDSNVFRLSRNNRAYTIAYNTDYRDSTNGSLIEKYGVEQRQFFYGYTDIQIFTGEIKKSIFTAYSRKIGYAVQTILHESEISYISEDFGPSLIESRYVLEHIDTGVNDTTWYRKTLINIL